MAPDVTVLVLVWNGRDFIRQCFASLLAQEYRGRFSILAVDNGSSDDSVAIIRDEFPQLALLPIETNLGFSKGNNTGLQALLEGRAPAPADGIPEIVILLNQDTEVSPGWLQNMVDTFERHPQAGIVGCKIYFPDGETLQHAGGEVRGPLGKGTNIGWNEQDTGQYEDEGPVEFVTGAAMAIQTEMLRKIGLFDEGFSPAYYEDADLCFRARAAGFEVIYTPKAQLKHHEGATIRVSDRHYWRTYHRNRLRFTLKYCSFDSFINDSVPAERAELEQQDTAYIDIVGRQQAYLYTLLTLPDILRRRYSSEPTEMMYNLLSQGLRVLHETAINVTHLHRAHIGYTSKNVE